MNNRIQVEAYGQSVRIYRQTDEFGSANPIWSVRMTTVEAVELVGILSRELGPLTTLDEASKRKLRGVRETLENLAKGLCDC